MKVTKFWNKMQSFEELLRLSNFHRKSEKIRLFPRIFPKTVRWKERWMNLKRLRRCKKVECCHLYHHNIVPLYSLPTPVLTSLCSRNDSRNTKFKVNDWSTEEEDLLITISVIIFFIASSLGRTLQWYSSDSLLLQSSHWGKLMGVSSSDHSIQGTFIFNQSDNQWASLLEF